MNHPHPYTLAVKRQEMTAYERELMEHMQVCVRAVFGGYEAVLMDWYADRECAHSKVRDTMLEAYIEGESMYFTELDRRLNTDGPWTRDLERWGGSGGAL